MDKVKLVRWVGNPQSCKGQSPQATWDFDSYDQAYEARTRDMRATGLPYDNYTIA